MPCMPLPSEWINKCLKKRDLRHAKSKQLPERTSTAKVEYPVRMQSTMQSTLPSVDPIETVDWIKHTELVKRITVHWDYIQQHVLEPSFWRLYYIYIYIVYHGVQQQVRTPLFSQHMRQRSKRLSGTLVEAGHLQARDWGDGCGHLWLVGLLEGLVPRGIPWNPTKHPKPFGSLDTPVHARPLGPSRTGTDRLFGFEALPMLRGPAMWPHGDVPVPTVNTLQVAGSARRDPGHGETKGNLVEALELPTCSPHLLC